MIATDFIHQGFATRKVLSVLSLSPSSYYQSCKANTVKKAKGIKPSNITYTHQGVSVANQVVVSQIKALLAKEFVDYGYFKVYHYLRQDYYINHKKVYRLMKENNLLYTNKQRKVGSKQWVKDLVPKPEVAFGYWEFDIKFMYVHGLGQYIPLLSVIDVKSRWLLGHLCQSSIKKEDVKKFMETMIATYRIPEKIVVRCDNGSQFESNLIRNFFANKQIYQEFTKPATPEQNAHIESYHSILEKIICRQYLFETKLNLKDKLSRWGIFYNYERIHSGVAYTSPYKALIMQNIQVDKIFLKAETNNNNIFIALKEKEIGNAGVQPTRDTLADWFVPNSQ
jgi:putative transposase